MKLERNYMKYHIGGVRWIEWDSWALIDSSMLWEYFKNKYNKIVNNEFLPCKLLLDDNELI